MTLTRAGDGSRLDQLLSDGENVSRSRAAALIRAGAATVNGRVETKPSFRPAVGDTAALSVPEARKARVEAEEIPLEVIFQDAYLAVVVKPAGMVVHPAAGNPDHTLVNALLYHLDGLSGIGGEIRPGIVHRLDKETSGLMLVAKDDRTHQRLSDMLAGRRIEKHYRAVVCGRMKEESGEIEAPIGRSHADRKKMAIEPDGRYALTKWRVMRDGGDRSLLDVRIVTGRTHQIRVHMRSIGHPVLGDALYGFKNMPKADRLMLHAYSLAFTHPITGEPMRFTAPCPFAEE